VAIVAACNALGFLIAAAFGPRTTPMDGDDPRPSDVG
jgi:hypothetical protein